MEHENAPSCGSILRYLREERGWSLQETVRQLGGLYGQEEGRPCPLTISMMGKWERNEHLPSPIYRKLFCLLYQQTASELGFLASRQLEAPPHAGVAEASPISTRASC